MQVFQFSKVRIIDLYFKVVFDELLENAAQKLIKTKISFLTKNPLVLPRK
jgi:hypothetical protein